MQQILTSKKAADPNQIFIYIAAVIIVGFVFLYGFKAITAISKSTQDVELAKFVKDFKSKANSVSTDFGSVQFISISIPSQFERVCIIEPTVQPPADCVSQIGTEICDAWTDYADPSNTDQKKNIFFIDQLNRVGYKDSIDSISLDTTANPEGFLCTKDGRLRLEGQARVAVVSADNS